MRSIALDIMFAAGKRTPPASSAAAKRASRNRNMGLPGMQCRNRIVISAVFVLAALPGCMDSGDIGLGPACESNVRAAERELSTAKANSIGTAVGWAQAAALIGAARTQQQFNEFQNCLLKARRARAIIAQSK